MGCQDNFVSMYLDSLRLENNIRECRVVVEGSKGIDRRFDFVLTGWILHKQRFAYVQSLHNQHVNFLMQYFVNYPQLNAHVDASVTVSIFVKPSFRI